MHLLTYSSVRDLMLNSNFLLLAVWFLAAEFISISRLVAGFTTKKTFAEAHCPLALYGVLWRFVVLHKANVCCFLVSYNPFGINLSPHALSNWTCAAKNNNNKQAKQDILKSAINSQAPVRKMNE